MMGAVHEFKLMPDARSMAQGLHVMRLHFGKIVIRDIQQQGPAKEKVQSLHAFADAKNWHASLVDRGERGEFPRMRMTIHAEEASNGVSRIA